MAHEDAEQLQVSLYTTHDSNACIPSVVYISVYDTRERSVYGRFVNISQCVRNQRQTCIKGLEMTCNETIISWHMIAQCNTFLRSSFILENTSRFP